MSVTTIELNGHEYQEAERGRFEAALVDNGEEIAHTNGDEVIMYSGNYEDVKLWAESYDIHAIKERRIR